MPHRLFIAIRPPREIRAALLARMGGIEGARWQDDDQLHLTLRFLGEVERGPAEDVALAVSRLRARRFALALRGVGTFARRGRVHTLWAGLAPSPELLHLQARVERLCQAAGLAPETRRFAPHITLARMNAASGAVGPFLAQHGDLAGAPWPVRGLALYESHLGAGGPSYEAIVETAFDE